MSKYSEKKQRQAIERLEAALAATASACDDDGSCRAEAPCGNQSASAPGIPHGLLPVAVGADPAGKNASSKKGGKSHPFKQRLTPEEQSARDKAAAAKTKEKFARDMKRVVLSHMRVAVSKLESAETAVNESVCPIANARSAARRGELRGELYGISGLFDSFSARFRECLVRARLLLETLEAGA